jgi:hypothetical protein
MRVDLRMVLIYVEKLDDLFIQAHYHREAIFVYWNNILPYMDLLLIQDLDA